MPGDVLSNRALNRATLARQSLLERSPESPQVLIERLVGMQGQNPLDPYYGLWARLNGFDPYRLGRSVTEGDVVRGQFMRGTIHMFTATDAARVHPLTANVLERVFTSTQFARDLHNVGTDQVLSAARELLGVAPRSRSELGAELAKRWPEVPAASLAQAATFLLPVLQMPPRGVWGESGQARWALFESLAPVPYGPPLGVDALVIRYLRAFGPASVKDMRNWSGLTGLRAAFEAVRPQLRAYRDTNGVELFDVEDGALPDPETPAPPRLLPEFDNILLGHDDRSRFFADDEVPKGWAGSVLADGVYAGSWRHRESVLELILTPHGLTHETEVAAEADRLARLAWPDQVPEIRIGA